YPIPLRRRISRRRFTSSANDGVRPVTGSGSLPIYSSNRSRATRNHSRLLVFSNNRATLTETSGRLFRIVALPSPGLTLFGPAFTARGACRPSRGARPPIRERTAGRGWDGARFPQPCDRCRRRQTQGKGEAARTGSSVAIPARPHVPHQPWQIRWTRHG